MKEFFSKCDQETVELVTLDKWRQLFQLQGAYTFILSHFHYLTLSFD